MTLVSGNIRFMRIFPRDPWRRGVKQQGGNRTRRLLVIFDATFWNFRIWSKGKGKCWVLAIATRDQKRFLPAHAMLARVFATATCLDVRPSVRHTPVLCLVQRKQDREMYTV